MNRILGVNSIFFQIVTLGGLVDGRGRWNCPSALFRVSWCWSGVYDAIRSERPYKKPMSHEEAFAILRDGRGRHFDPQVVDIFLSFDAQVQQVREQWGDS